VLNSASGRVLLLQKIGNGGLEALKYLRSGASAPDDWKQVQLEIIAQAEKPDASLLRLPWMGSYRALVLAAADVSSLKKLDRKDWKQRILDQAAKDEPKQKYTW